MAPRPGESLAQYDAGIRSAISAQPAGADVVLNRVTRGIYVGVAGNVVVQFCDDADAAPVTLSGLAAGVWHPMQVQRIVNAGTTATGILAGF